MSIVWKEGDPPIVGEFLELIAAAGMGRRSAGAAARSLAGGQFCVTARDGARLVGVGRVVTDGGLSASIEDIAVHPDWQGQGIGTDLTRRLVDWCRETLPRGAHVSAIALPGSFSLYRAAGFETRTGKLLILK